jgi:ParB-like chromosome segregation protein Spo0J
MGGYALDLTSPIRHVATELDRADKALSIGELADTYHHPNHADIVRIQQHEGCETEHDAVLWLMNRAIEKIEYRGKTSRSTVQIVADNGGFRLADGMTFEQLEYGGKSLHRERDDHVQFGDAFNPVKVQAVPGAPGGERRFSENVRRNTGKDTMDELRESLRSFGWIEELPAIKDERGVVLVGHRRLAVAAELEIEPVVKTVRLGDGDEADAKRFALAVASNLGSKPFTPEERKDLAEYLYGERDWSQERIAEALHVGQATVSRDLSELSTVNNSKASRGGRPKGSKSARPQARQAPPELEDEILAKVEAGKPVNRTELAEEFGVGDGVVYSAHQRALGRAEGRKESAAAVPSVPDVTPVTDVTDVTEATCTCPCPVHGRP